MFSVIVFLIFQHKNSNNGVTKWRYTVLLNIYLCIEELLEDISDLQRKANRKRTKCWSAAPCEDIAWSRQRAHMKLATAYLLSQMEQKKEVRYKRMEYECGRKYYVQNVIRWLDCYTPFDRHCTSMCHQKDIRLAWGLVFIDLGCQITLNTSWGNTHEARLF